MQKDECVLHYCFHFLHSVSRDRHLSMLRWYPHLQKPQQQQQPQQLTDRTVRLRQLCDIFFSAYSNAEKRRAAALAAANSASADQFNGSQLRPAAELSLGDFEHVTDEVLERIADKVDDLLSKSADSSDYDVTLASGVLTLSLGEHGTYVINKQTPNRQIWLSSPTSGPKRFDYSADSGEWTYSHDGSKLHQLLTKELSEVFQQLNSDTNIDFTDCAVYKLDGS
uniref:ferroxidase n=1 Tax=Macrostomum lignano TaxID=282301 RepID=A0A1I8G240_9PLAT